MIDNGDEKARPRPVSRLAELNQHAAPPADSEGPAAPPAPPMTELALAQMRVAQLLEDFRGAAVLVPFDDQDSLWTADFGGVRWICAFTDEAALARFARVQNGASREWVYQTILGARLLDEMVPLLPGPAGVALDAGSDDGMVFPPVAGIVPDAVAVDLGRPG
ncbi:SseB family protein [Streptomyces sp. NPDC005805]|uniref:SseB family protein n=1 Tax=Streptomyces sp. NPDC005805 TaxID=3157068 RepID=UPI003407E351